MLCGHFIPVVLWTIRMRLLTFFFSILSLVRGAAFLNNTIYYSPKSNVYKDTSSVDL